MVSIKKRGRKRERGREQNFLSSGLISRPGMRETNWKRVRKKLELGWVARTQVPQVRVRLTPIRLPLSVGVLAAPRNNRIAAASRMHDRRGALPQIDLTFL